jgi:hypothetical protein
MTNLLTIAGNIQLLLEAGVLRCMRISGFLTLVHLSTGEARRKEACTVTVAKTYFKVIKCTLIILGKYNFVGDRYYFTAVL